MLKVKPSSQQPASHSPSQPAGPVSLSFLHAGPVLRWSVAKVPSHEYLFSFCSLCSSVTQSRRSSPCSPFIHSGKKPTESPEWSEGKDTHTEKVTVHRSTETPWGNKELSRSPSHLFNFFSHRRSLISQGAHSSLFSHTFSCCCWLLLRKLSSTDRWLVILEEERTGEVSYLVVVVAVDVMLWC